MFKFFRTLFIILISFSLGALVSIKVLQDNPELIGSKTPFFGPVGELINTTFGKPRDVDFGLYWDAYSKIMSKYPKEIDQQELVYGAIRGSVAALGDRFSLFLSPNEAERFFEDINGEFSGIGAELTQEGDLFLVVAPLAGSPAEQAGLKAQDVIVSVDGKEATEFKFGELINAIRGPKGSQVVLGVFREGFDEPQDFTITRDTIEIESLRYEQRDDGLAYVKLIQFSDDTTTELEKVVGQIKESGAKGLILDLRNNPGGFLDTSIEISSFFIDKGPVVIEERKGGEREVFKVNHEPILKDFPTVVLVNGGSASASEILAGALQDTGKATLVGTQTFGKGSVQEVESLEDGSALRLTVAKWLTPKEREINGEGIAPDIVIDEEITADNDPQLNKAVELLLK
ncbi:S41 family peptidase [Candidatus Berkelbacteria bacterium]|nr:S41 family peptidase [Candidatus Berkelbacteria bacterium]